MFQEIASDLPINNIPVILIDISGSTEDKFKGLKTCKRMTVREYEFDLALNICKNSNYEQAHIITWSTTGNLFENQSINSIHKLKKNTSSGGGTMLKSGLKHIKDEFFVNDKITRIIVITDGEISDNNSQICDKLNMLCKNNICIEIIAVETNNCDYSNANISVGNAFYNMVKKNNMTRLINKFSVYNENEIEFINFSNPQVKEGYIPYYDKMFNINDLKKFIEHVNESAKGLLNSNVKTLKFEIIKFSQNLSLSLYHITKNYTHQQQLTLIELFCNMFKESEYYSQVRQILLNEVNNHIVGKASTYQELRKEKYISFENTNIDLMTDTEKAICGDSSNNIISGPKYSFLLMDNNKKHFVIETFDDKISNILNGFTTYKNSSIQINNYCFPIMFDFIQKQTNASALQWLKFNYSKKLNISMSNEYIYYYLLCDAYLVRNNIKLTKIYNKYIFNALNDTKYGSNLTILNEMIKTKTINIPYGILQDAVKYYSSNIKPLTLYYLICNKYLLTHLNNDSVISSLKKYCLKDIHSDLELSLPSENPDHNTDIDWNLINEKLDKKYSNEIDIVTFNNIEQNILNPHTYGNLDFECSSKNGIQQGDDIICNICASKINYTKINKTVDLSHLNSYLSTMTSVKNHLYDLNKHINHGLLNGIPDNEIINVTDFNSGYDSYSVDNTIIIDPISNSRLKISTQEEFINYVHLKYPFIKDINMTNMALCGGFVRSILLKQQMKDFDFFFYGLENNQAYIERLKSIVNNLTTTLRTTNDKLKFVFFYKPLFNVLEMICYEDPGNFIKEDYTLEFFDKYKFKSMKKYTPRIKKENNNNNENGSSNSDSDSDSNSDSDEYEYVENDNAPVDKKYYFEDGDKNGIKMVHRMQFIMCKYETIYDIFKSFDMFPSQVAFDGLKVHFTKKSLMAYQYMINEINVYGGTCLAKHRINKYFKYGFAIVLPPTDRNWNDNKYGNVYKQQNINYKGTNENVGPLKFKVRKVQDNMIYINHNSNMEQMLERNESLEAKAKTKGESLYTSILFCSFVAVLRYVKINNINYGFPKNDKLDDLFEDNKIKLKNGDVELSFINNQTSIYPTTDWYYEFVKSIILEKY